MCVLCNLMGICGMCRKKRKDKEDNGMTEETEDPRIQKTAGYLEKRGKVKFINSWKKYWFVLDGQLLLYYASQDDAFALSPCKGSISLGPSCSVKPYSSAPIGFQITTRSSTITLRAEDTAEQTKWMQAILSSLNQNQNINKSPTRLDHFRYSTESSQSQEMKIRDKIPHQGQDSELLHRLQRLGAKSYQLSSAEESSPKKLHPNILGELSEINKRRNTAENTEVVLDDDDFCVCTLGKDQSEQNPRRTITSVVKEIKNVPEYAQVIPKSQRRTISRIEPKVEEQQEEETKLEIKETDKDPKEETESRTIRRCSREISLIGDGEFFVFDKNIKHVDAEPNENLPKRPALTENKDNSVELEYENEMYAVYEGPRNDECKEPYNILSKNSDEVFEYENETYGAYKEPNTRLSTNADSEFEFDNELYGVHNEPSVRQNNPDVEFECDNELYVVYNEPNNRCSRNEFRAFQFPPAPTEEFIDDHKYSEPTEVRSLDFESEECRRPRLSPFFRNESNNLKCTEDHKTKTEFQFDSEIYTDPRNVCNNDVIFRAPIEYIECDNKLYDEPNVEINKNKDSLGEYAEPQVNIHNFKGNEEIYSKPNIEGSGDNNERLGAVYSEPNYTEAKHVEGSNVYEDPELLLIKKDEQTNEEEKSTKKKKRKMSSSKNDVDTEEDKKADNFLKRWLKNTGKKHGDKSDRCSDSTSSEVADVDTTLVMLTDIQQILEQKKKLIKALSQQNAKATTEKGKGGSENKIAGDRLSSKSEPQKSPDLLRDLNDNKIFTSTFSVNLENNYSVVHDALKNGSEGIYSEVMNSTRTSNELRELLEDLMKCQRDGRPYRMKD